MTIAIGPADNNAAPLSIKASAALPKVSWFGNRLAVKRSADEIHLPVPVALLIAQEETVAISLFVDVATAKTRIVPTPSTNVEVRSLRKVALSTTAIIRPGKQAIFIAPLESVRAVSIVVIVSRVVDDRVGVDPISLAVAIMIPVAITVLVFVLISVTVTVPIPVSISVSISIPIAVSVLVFILISVAVAVAVSIPVTITVPVLAFVPVFILVLIPILVPVDISVFFTTIFVFVYGSVPVDCGVVQRGAISTVFAAITISAATKLPGTAIAAGSSALIATPIGRIIGSATARIIAAVVIPSISASAVVAPAAIATVVVAATAVVIAAIRAAAAWTRFTTTGRFRGWTWGTWRRTLVLGLSVFGLSTGLSWAFEIVAAEVPTKSADANVNTPGCSL